MQWWLLKRIPELTGWLQEVKDAAATPLCDALAIFGGIAGVASAVLSIANLDPQLSALFNLLVVISVALLVLSFFSIVGYSIWRTRQTESSQIIPFAHNTFIHVISGDDFVRNFKRFYERHASDYGNRAEMVCVCGLGRSALISDLTEGSVIRSLMEQIVRDTGTNVDEDGNPVEFVDTYAMQVMQREITRGARRIDLLRSHDITREMIHDRLTGSDADAEQGGESGSPNGPGPEPDRERLPGGITLDELKRRYTDQLEELDRLAKAPTEEAVGQDDKCPELEIGDCLLVRYDRAAFSRGGAPTTEDGKPFLPENFAILFLVNCSKNKNIVAADPNAIIGPASYSIMHYIFDFIRDRKVNLDVLFLPVLGTNRLNNSHQTVITSIVQRFCVDSAGLKRSYDLAISVNENSIKKDNLTLVKLRRYISEVMRFNS